MTVSKKMLSLILSAAFGIILLAIVGLTQMSRVYETTNYANVNVVPSVLTLDEAFARWLPPAPSSGSTSPRLIRP
jgi:methyl-accepting chemotaxis protein